MRKSCKRTEVSERAGRGAEVTPGVGQLVRVRRPGREWSLPHGQLTITVFRYAHHDIRRVLRRKSLHPPTVAAKCPAFDVGPASVVSMVPFASHACAVRCAWINAQGLSRQIEDPNLMISSGREETPIA